MSNESDLQNELFRSEFTMFAIKAFEILNPVRKLNITPAFMGISHVLGEVAAGRLSRVLITVPPRSGKSYLASSAFPAYLLGCDPSMRIIAASYSNELAAKFARDCRSIMGHERYRILFPDTTIQGKNTETEIETSLGGFRLATSVGGTLTGRGGNLIIIDDPMKADEAMSRATRDRTWDWFTGVASSRLDNKAEDKIIVVMQRLHADDIAARLIERGDWHHLCLPAIAECDQHFDIPGGRIVLRKAGDVLDPYREPLPVLERLKRDLGSSVFQAQYQQQPVPESGMMIKREWIQWYDRRPERKPGQLIVHSWDTAQKAGAHNDFSVGTIWLVQGADAYLLNVVRGRFDYPELRNKIREQYFREKPNTILIEETGVGTAVAQELGKMAFPVLAFRVMDDKQTRMSVQSAKIEQGRLHLPRGANWIGDFVDEILAFPNGRHDDQVDTVSQLFAWLDRRKMGAVIGSYNYGYK